jgi:pantoate--beta-alanine ligase
VRDLNMPVRMVVAPTLRETDGLACSSRNARLTGLERGQAVALWEALQEARRQVRASARAISSARLRKDLTEQIQKRPAARVDYIEFFDPWTLEPVERVAKGVRMALAVWLGTTRLIDNGRL